MITQTDLERLRNRMLEKRKDLLDSRERIEQTWETARERTVELEERAQKETLADADQALEERELAEIRAIDAAMGRIEAGDYGLCSSCGEPISVRRLDAVPWAEMCKKCVKASQPAGPATRPPGAPVEHKAGLPPQLEGMDDAQVEEAVWDALVRDGRVETRELDIVCDEGLIILDGILPSEEHHEMLMQIVQDRMGIRDFDDNTRADPTAWERPDRTPGDRREEQTPDKAIYEGTTEKEQMYDSQTQGEPTIPPDHIRKNSDHEV
ncbi:MAG: TraR/DksA C4-type zinc finger protein [Desulfatibacillaceae bacterium]